MAAIVRSVGVNGPTVEDVVHDAFEMACRKTAAERPDPKDEARFGGWLCTLARYAALTTRNDCARSREISAPSEELEDVAEFHAAYVGNFDDKVAAAVVFANLNVEDRQLLHQHFYEEKTVKELAEERGVPWTTMRSRLDGVIDRARSIMYDKSFRRRGMGAVAFCWLMLHVRDLQARVQTASVQSKRMALAGVLVTGGALAGAVLLSAQHASVDSYANKFVVAFPDAPQHAGSSLKPLPASGPSNPSFANSSQSTAGAGQSAKVSSTPAALSTPATPSTLSTNKGGQTPSVEERARSIPPWSLSAAVRDDEPKRR